MVISNIFKRVFKISSFVFFLALLPSLFLNQVKLFAQEITTSNQFIAGSVDSVTGLVTVFLPPGRRGIDKQLSFFHKSFFSCKIGDSIFTNNTTIKSQISDRQFLGFGSTKKIVDTLRTIWLGLDSVDVIQDVFPFAQQKSGLVVYRWKYLNHSSKNKKISCQYLQDPQTTDPTESGNNSTDNPFLITKWESQQIWQQYPHDTLGIPPFFVCFLHQPPNAPSFNIGLSAIENCFDNREGSLNPVRMTIGDWQIMRLTPYSADAGWPVNQRVSFTSDADNAVLLEFPEQNIQPNKIIEVGNTSYGTAEFETCTGNIFGLLFYPQRLPWNSHTFNYDSNPFEVQFYPFDADQSSTAMNTKVTLTVGQNLSIVTDYTGKNIVGRAQTLPLNGTGIVIAPREMAKTIFEWWVRADQVTGCTGDFVSSLKLTGVSSLGTQTFVRTSDGADTCDHQMLLECSSLSSVGKQQREYQLSLLQISPNPFSNIATIKYITGENGFVRLFLYDLLGKNVLNVVDQIQEQGLHEINFDGSKLPLGSYIVRLENGGEVLSRKIVIQR